MSHLILPENYDPMIDLMESQRAIKKIKDYFQQELAYGLNLEACISAHSSWILLHGTQR